MPARKPATQRVPLEWEDTPAVKIAEIDYDLCQACNKCSARKSCRTKALTQMDRGEPAMVKPAECMGCGDCVEACPHAAVRLRES